MDSGRRATHSWAMFTGLVQGVGEVASRGPLAGREGVTRLLVEPRWDVPPRSPMEAGESICVGGVCLTLVEATGGGLAFDVVRETLDRTTLGRLAAGSRVNLERSLTANDLMGGHVVQGHIDGTAEVLRVDAVDDWRVWLRPGRGPGGEDLMQYVVPKGSICVEGVSLTVAGVEPGPGGRPEAFWVALIPTTLARTTLAALKPGDRANLETDVQARTIVHWLRHYAAHVGGGGGGAPR